MTDSDDAPEAAGDPVERFGSTLTRLYDELDWDRVAEVYCEGDATGFFDDERRAAVLDAGLKLAADIGEALEKRKKGTGGRSLYIGAAVAELPLMLFESIVLGRKVAWVTLESVETTELTRAIKKIDATLPKPRTGPMNGRDLRPRDHIWMTSVLTDPDAFPALHDQLYKRQGTKDAVRGGRPKAERLRATALVNEALAAAAAETLLSTTDEELEFWEPLVAEAGGSIKVLPTGRTSAIVGDIIRSCQLRMGPDRRQ